MGGWRTESWRLSSGGGLVSCGISRTEDGYAVDVSHGDTCIDRIVCVTRAEAELAARTAKLRYADRRPPRPVRTVPSLPDTPVRLSL